MTTDDDRFEDTLRNLLRLAGSDTPAGLHTVSVRSNGRHVARYFGIAAAAVVAIGAAAVVATHQRANERAVSTPVTKTTTDATVSIVSTTTLPVPATTGRCGMSGITGYTDDGPAHTIVKAPQRFEVMVTINAATDSMYCSGDVVPVTLVITNVGGAAETIDPLLILSDGPTAYPLASDANSRLELRPGATESTTINVTLPGVPPGDYSVGLYGFDSWAPIKIVNPPICDDSRVTATATGDGAMGTIREILSITNTTASPCFVNHVSSVRAVYRGGRPTAQIFPIKHLDTSVLTPLASHVLSPGSTARMVITSSDVCPSAASNPGPITGLILIVSLSPEASISIDVTGLGLRAECGVAMSEWGATPS